MGIVHHSHYPVWFEIGRTDLLRQLGKTYASLEEEGLLLPLTNLRCKYIAPARYGDEITVRTNVEKLTCARIEFAYKIYNHEETLLTVGGTEHGWTDGKLKPVNLLKKRPELYRILQASIDGGCGAGK
jgi:acyl-CoA thioester hydrolase